ncbi:MAG: hypothetical protein MPJ78_19640 [Hyphomicrobiaceae bacterium]|nr:hypothetical protein [Hyphomicrobiaceae bacterium]
MGFKQAKSKLIENGPLILSIFLNLQLPFLGVFATLNNSRIRYFSLFIAATIGFVLAFPAAHDIFLSSFYLKHGSIVLFIIISIAFIASIYISIKEKKKLKYHPYTLLSVFVFLIIYGYFSPIQTVGTNYIISNNLSPYLKAHTALLFSAPQGKLKKGFTIVKQSDGNESSIGYVIAVEGDRIGLAGDIPVVCKNINTSETCFDIRNVCEYLLGDARSIESKLSKSRKLNTNEIALATFLNIQRYESLNIMIINYDRLYNLEKTFDMKNIFNFGTESPNEYCQLPVKEFNDLSL